MSETTITFLVLAATVVVFVWDYLPVAIVAIGVSLPLWTTGVLELDQVLAGFDEPENSVKGQLVARFLSELLGLDLYASRPA
jgi:hypothetical protein